MSAPTSQNVGSTGVLPVAAPSWLARRLERTLPGLPDGRLRLLHPGPLATYVVLPTADGDRALGLLAAAAVGVPVGLQTGLDRGLETGPAPGPSTGPSTGPAGVAGAELRLVDGTLWWADRPIRITRLVDLTVPRLPLAAGPSTVAAEDPAWALTLIGRGDGLTPYGDDVLCGWLAAHRALGVATPAVDATVRAHLDRTTTLSASLLEAALDGIAIRAFSTWLRRRGGPEETAARQRLLAVGGSSGAGLLAGAEQALERLLPATVQGGEAAARLPAAGQPRSDRSPAADHHASDPDRPQTHPTKEEAA